MSCVNGLSGIFNVQSVLLTLQVWCRSHYRYAFPNTLYRYIVTRLPTLHLCVPHSVLMNILPIILHIKFSNTCAVPLYSFNWGMHVICPEFIYFAGLKEWQYICIVLQTRQGKKNIHVLKWLLTRVQFGDWQNNLFCSVPKRCRWPDLTWTLMNTTADRSRDVYGYTLLP